MNYANLCTAKHINAKISSAGKPVGWNDLHTVSQCVIWTEGIATLGEKRKKLVPVSFQQWEGTGAGTIWAVCICQIVTEWSLPDHFAQVTSHLVLTAPDHGILSKTWMDNPEVLCNDYLQKEDWIKTKQQHGLKYEEVKL